MSEDALADVPVEGGPVEGGAYAEALKADPPEPVDPADPVEGSGGRAKPWTLAMEEALADGEWHPYEEIVKVGQVLVPDERALSEVATRHDSEGPSAIRLEAARRTVAGQALVGMRRFAKVETKGRGSAREVRRTEKGSDSLGAQRARIDELETTIENLEARLHAAETALRSADLLPEEE